MARALASRLFIMRLLSTIAAAVPRPASLLSRRSLISPHTVRPLFPALFLAARFGGIRCRVNRAGKGGDSAYSPLNSRSSSSSFSDRPPTEMAHLFPGCDYQHWLTVMDNSLDKILNRFFK
ncbi:hypothetical protein HN51_028623 [Arachis hypogaea]|uniref:Uncharacterized protein n=1 Tax=Arachis hypogaea TaxID=3818 RepID=A0A445BI30_ARAHY|nr:multiple organellar RNA editing factor 5, chloroplastic/mitochondrial-like [Arachis hypogaea]RYR38320.1 hypothetical protein Ahy_A09g043335 [Arachis hypogaea]